MSYQLSLDVGELNEELRSLSAEERLDRILKITGVRPLATTSFGRDSAIMLHIINQVCPTLLVAYIDHGCWPEDSLVQRETFVTECKKRFAPNLLTYKPQRNLSYGKVEEAFRTKNALRISRLKIVGKIAPLERALANTGANLWISGVSSYQTGHRGELGLVTHRRDGVYKFHPLLDWTKEQREGYIKRHELPRNNFHFDIFKGFGQNLECGLHQSGSGI